VLTAPKQHHHDDEDDKSDYAEVEETGNRFAVFHSWLLFQDKNHLKTRVLLIKQAEQGRGRDEWEKGGCGLLMLNFYLLNSDFSLLTSDF